MTEKELLKLREHINKGYYETMDTFREFCHSSYCEDLCGYPAEVLLDGEQDNEFERIIQNNFSFSNGAARRIFDILRNKGGLLDQLYMIISDELYGKGENKHDGYEDRSRRWSKDDIRQLKLDSEAVITEEKAFVELADEALMILDIIQKEQ